MYEIRKENNERVNSTAAYDKQYLEGRYGADPYLTNMLVGGERNESKSSEKSDILANLPTNSVLMRDVC